MRNDGYTAINQYLNTERMLTITAIATELYLTGRSIADYRDWQQSTHTSQSKVLILQQDNPLPLIQASILAVAWIEKLKASSI
jgi:hypothetical protein